MTLHPFSIEARSKGSFIDLTLICLLFCGLVFLLTTTAFGQPKKILLDLGPEKQAQQKGPAKPVGTDYCKGDIFCPDISDVHLAIRGQGKTG